MSIIEKIYSNFQTEKDEEYVEKAYEQYHNEANKIIPEDKFIELESAISAYAADSEKQGFINGFKLAMQICNESLMTSAEPTPSESDLLFIAKGNQV